MFWRRPNRVVCFILGLALSGLLALTLPGCAAWGARSIDGEPFPQWDWGTGLRPPGGDSGAWGVDPRARQIERNLGVQ